MSHISLAVNPVASYPTYRQKLLEVLPDIDQIDSWMVKLNLGVKPGEP